VNAITLRNPRAAAVVFGYDTDVLRRETTRHRGVVLIHAGKEYDTRVRAWDLPHEDLRQHAIGYVLLDDVRRRNDGWYVWDFKHPHVFPEPFEMRGLPGMYPVEASDELLKQLEVAMKPEQAKQHFRHYEQLANPDSVHPRRRDGWVGD
jgi:hypothetical protein